MKRNLFACFFACLVLLTVCTASRAYTATPNLSAGGTNTGLVASGALGYTVLSPTDGTTVLQARSTSGITDQGNGYYVITGGVTFTTQSILVKWDRSDTGAVLGVGTTVAPASSGASTTPALALTITHNSSSQPVLTWTADPLATAYLVTRSTGTNSVGDVYTVIATVAAPTLTYTDVAEPSGTNRYRILPVH